MQDKRAVERVNIEKVYHPFITGAYNKLVGELMQETGARINVPPPSVNKTEIVITGEKEQVALAMAKIKKIYEEKVSSIIQEKINWGFLFNLTYWEPVGTIDVTIFNNVYNDIYNYGLKISTRFTNYTSFERYKAWLSVIGLFTI